MSDELHFAIHFIIWVIIYLNGSNTVARFRRQIDPNPPGPNTPLNEFLVKNQVKGFWRNVGKSISYVLGNVIASLDRFISFEIFYWILYYLIFIRQSQ